MGGVRLGENESIVKKKIVHAALHTLVHTHHHSLPPPFPNIQRYGSSTVQHSIFGQIVTDTLTVLMVVGGNADNVGTQLG